MVASEGKTVVLILFPFELIVPFPLKITVSIVFPPYTWPALLKVRLLNEPGEFQAVEEPVTASKITSLKVNPGP